MNLQNKFLKALLFNLYILINYISTSYSNSTYNNNYNNIALFNKTSANEIELDSISLFNKITNTNKAIKSINLNNNKHRHLEFISSLDKNFISTISNDLVHSLKKQELFSKGQRVYSTDILTEIRGDKDSILTINLRNLNSEYSTDPYNPVGMYLNDEKLNIGKNYYINYNVTDDTRFSYFIPSHYNNSKADEYIAGCNYTINNVAYTNFTFGSLKDLNLIVKYRTINFGLINNSKGAYYIVQSNNTLNMFLIDNYIKEDYNSNGVYLPDDLRNAIFSEIEFTNIFISDFPYDEDSYLTLQIKDNKLIVFRIITYNNGLLEALEYICYIDYTEILLSNTSNINISLNYDNNDLNNTDVINKTSNVKNKSESINISDLKSKKQNFYLNLTLNSVAVLSKNKILICSSEGVYEYMYNNDLKIYKLKTIILNFIYFKSSSESINVKANCLSIIALNKSSFIAIKSFGLIQIENNNLRLTNYKFELSNIVSLDLIINPILLTKFLGVVLDNTINKPEFLIEINVDDENNPLINKVFTSITYLNLVNNILNDFYYSYILSPENTKLIVIRRGVINNIPTISNSVNLSKISSNYTNFKLHSLYSYDDNLNLLSFINYNTNVIMSITEFQYPDDYLICSFNKAGYYNITFEKYAEACENSLKYNYAYAYCNMYIYFNLRIYGKGITDVQIIGITIGVMIFAGLVIFIFIVILTLRDYFNKRKLNKPKPKREELYLDNDEIYYKNNENKNEHNIIRGSKYMVSNNYTNEDNTNRNNCNVDLFANMIKNNSSLKNK